MSEQRQVITYDGMLVLMTSQLAQEYETDPSYIVKNFNNNKTRYVLGKHYFVLEGDEKRRYASESRIYFHKKDHGPLYLWALARRKPLVSNYGVRRFLASALVFAC